ncbi:MAG: hypothetical protein OSJ58_20645, partial [Dysosmobacter sp.]|nr:hypothetical protein [Dysosmobacter sp.]
GHYEESAGFFAACGVKVERLWLQKQCVLLARHNNGSPLDWLNVPLWQLDGWIEVTNELNEKRGEG